MNKFKDQTIQGLPLSTILILFISFKISLAVGVTGYLSFRNGQKAVNDLASKLQREVSGRITQRIETYLHQPLILAKQNQDIIDRGLIDIQDTQGLGQLFWSQVHTTPVSYILLGRTSGEHLAAGYHFDDARITIDEVNPIRYGNSHLYVYETDQNGQLSTVRHDKGDVFSEGKSLIQKEGWYAEAVKREKPVWTPVYNWEVSPFPLAIATSRPIFDPNQNLLGVIGVEQQLSQISDFFQQLRISPSGKAFVIERSGLLIASSSDEQPFKVQQNKPVRLSSAESQDTLIRTTSLHLMQRFGTFRNIQDAQQLKFRTNGECQFVQVLPLTDPLGLEWLVVVVVPESDFMTQIHQNTRTTLILCCLVLLLAIALGILMARRIVKPAFELSQASYAIASGDLKQTVQIKGIQEFSTLSRAFNIMVERLQTSFHDLEDANEELEARVAARTESLKQTNQALECEILEKEEIEKQLRHGSLHDSLTDCPNRAFLMERLDLALKRAKRSNHYLFAVLFIDLDRFKVINDSLGHDVGDQLLIAIAQALETLVRETDIISRLGGDEFVILLDPISNLNEAIKVAERIVDTLNRPIQLEQHQVSTTASIGVTLSASHYQNGSEILRDADIAMYRAKEKGKARYEVFNEEMYTQAFSRLQLESDLRDAQKHQSFHLHYQPILSLSTNRILGFEALIRWHRGNQGWVTPSDFIPIAEETGLIIPIGEWVLQTACEQIKQWQDHFPTIHPLFISVNLSLKQIIQPNFLMTLDAILTRNNLSSHSLNLELTESMLMDNIEAVLELLSRLRERDIHISIDDFGTGFSSLRYLENFPINSLKIDQSFIQQMSPENQSKRMVETIINLAHRLGMQAIAEGVETSEQFRKLHESDCESAQGHFICPPLPADDAFTFLERNQLSFQ